MCVPTVYQPLPQPQNPNPQTLYPYPKTPCKRGIEIQLNKVSTANEIYLSYLHVKYGVVCPRAFITSPAAGARGRNYWVLMMRRHWILRGINRIRALNYFTFLFIKFEYFLVNQSFNIYRILWFTTILMGCQVT